MGRRYCMSLFDISNLLVVKRWVDPTRRELVFYGGDSIEAAAADAKDDLCALRKWLPTAIPDDDFGKAIATLDAVIDNPDRRALILSGATTGFERIVQDLRRVSAMINDEIARQTATTTAPSSPAPSPAAPSPDAPSSGERTR